VRFRWVKAPTSNELTQLTYKPSLTLEKDWVFIPGLRMRFVF
jgi:hypothetical protein